MRAAACMLCLALAGCGELSNAPLRAGSISGVVVGADSKSALVSILGHPQLRASVEADGTFTLDRAPTGGLELFVIADRARAARVSVSVGGAQRTDVTVLPEAGAFVAFTLRLPAGESGSRFRLSIDGTPFIALPFEPGGAQRLGPLPAGCYAAIISAALRADFAVSFCVQAGEARELTVPIGDPPGCAEAGCQSGLLCAADGRCVECTGNADCAFGFSCRSNECVADQPVAACAACTDDSQCAGGTCEGGSGGEPRLCRTPCSSALPCPQSGFTCDGQYCQPDPTEFSSCSGYRHVGTPCIDDSQCRAEGMVNGRCEEGVCTIECGNDLQCPEGARCLDGGTLPVCVVQ